MGSKTNMERAKNEERAFWILGAILIPAFVFRIFNAGEVVGGFNYEFALFFLVGTMAGCTFRGFRALKREIADLKSGDADDSTATQDSE